MRRAEDQQCRSRSQVMLRGRFELLVVAEASRGEGPDEVVLLTFLNGR